MNGAVVTPAPRLNTERGKPAERRAGSIAAAAAAATAAGGGQAYVRPQVKLAGGWGGRIGWGGGCRMGVGRVGVRRGQGLTSKPSISLSSSLQIEKKSAAAAAATWQTTINFSAPHDARLWHTHTIATIFQNLLPSIIPSFLLPRFPIFPFVFILPSRHMANSWALHKRDKARKWPPESCRPHSMLPASVDVSTKASVMWPRRSLPRRAAPVSKVDTQLATGLMGVW